MAELPDHYAVLNVSPSSDAVVIAAAYKALMKKHHPDKNADSSARDKTIAINLAFEILGDPAKRAAYDAAFRSVQSGTGRSSPPPTPPPSRTPPPAEPSEKDRPAIDRAQWTPLFAVGAIVLAAVAFGARKPASPPSTYGSTTVEDVTIENGLGYASTGFAHPYDPEITTGTTNTQDLVSVFGGSSYQAPTTLEFADIEGGANDFSREFNRGGMRRARAFSERCHKAAASQLSWSALDKCAAFDFAAAYAGARLSREEGEVPNTYFQFQLDNQADHYREIAGSVISVRDRLAAIRRSAEPIADQVLNAISRREEARRPVTNEAAGLDLNLDVEN